MTRRLPAMVALLSLVASSALAQEPQGDAPRTGTTATSRPIDVLDALRPQAGGMTAEEAARRAVQRAPTVAGARDATGQAEAAAAATQLRLIPRIDLSAGYRRISNIDQPPFEFGGTTIDNPFPVLVNRYDLRANLTVPVTDIFLSILPSYRSASALVDMARYQTEAQEQFVAFRARQTFYDVVQAKGAELVAQDSVRVLEANVDDIEALAQAGVVTSADAQRARAQLASARVRLARIRAGLDVQIASFEQFVAGGEDVPTTLGEDLLQPPGRQLPEARALLRVALQHRPEVRALRAVIRARESAVTANRSRMIPRLDLVGNVTYARPNQVIVPLQDEFRTSWEAGVVLSFSPNDLLTGNQAVNQAEHELSRARHDLQALQDGVTIEVAQALANYRAAREAITAGTEGLAAAQATYVARRDLLSAGEATTSEFLEAETALRQAQLEIVNAYVDLRKALAEADKAIGQAAPRASRSARATGVSR